MGPSSMKHLDWKPTFESTGGKSIKKEDQLVVA